MKNRLLMVQVVSYVAVDDYMYTKGLPELRRRLIDEFPEMKPFIDKKAFNLPPMWDKMPRFNWWKSANVSGSFIAVNLDTPTTVLEDIVSWEQILDELVKGKNEDRPYTHVGFSIFVASFSKFKKWARAVKKFDPSIITIAGNVGVLFEEAKKYVDYICHGFGVPFLRNLFGENGNSYKLSAISSPIEIEALGCTFTSDQLMITTKLGCPNRCNFCTTNQLFHGKFIPAFATPQEVYECIINYYKNNRKDAAIMFSEPTAIVSHNWWYELFELFENEPREYRMSMATTLASLRKFDFDRITNSSLHFLAFLIGIESYSVNYSKNPEYEKQKEMVQKLSEYGIGTLGTFMIGFDNQDRYMIWEEIDKLIELNLTDSVVLNLQPLPPTDFWQKLKYEGRLLDIPISFYYINGFLTFEHPYFKPGFEDMLPLVYDITKYILIKTGGRIVQSVRILKTYVKNRESVFGKGDKVLKSARKRLRFQKEMATASFESWKNSLNPTQEDIDNYLNILK